jgi:hypothetical protein
MKLTMVEHPPGAVNQIPGQATFRVAALRFSPFSFLLFFHFRIFV